MKKLLIFLLLLPYLSLSHTAVKLSRPYAPLPQAVENSCSKWPLFTKSLCKRVNQTWYEGKKELYFSGYAWHNRYTYEKERLKNFNEMAWGGGLGKGFFDEKGNWHGLLALAFLDSHKHLEPAAGYGFLKIIHLSPHFNLGAGYSIFITQRSDVFKGVPFAGIIPLISLIYRAASLNATYIPGAANAGNVLFIIAKLNFNDF